MQLQEYIENLARDCIHYSDNHPCRKHLKTGETCKCQSYEKRTGKALFIQLSSPETVIRSNALLQRIRQENPGLHIVYLTNWPDLLGNSVTETIRPDGAGFARVQCELYDQAWNLDTHREACTVMQMIQSETKGGVGLSKCQTQPMDSAAGFFANSLIPAREHHSMRTIPLRRHIQDLFAICQLEYNREMPRLKLSASHIPNLIDIASPICLIHLNDRWQFTTNQWQAILNRLEGTVILTGDETSDLYARHIAHRCDAIYSGPISMRSWIHYAAVSDLVIAPAGWQAETAWALGKQVFTVQMSPQDQLYQPDDFPGRMLQIGHHQLTIESLAYAIIENLITYSFDPDGLLARMKYPERSYSTHTTP